MSPHLFIRSATSRRLLACLLALALGAAACGSSDGEDEGATDTTVTEDSAVDDTTDESTDEDDDAEEDVAVDVEGEEDAMGEDDAMVDDSVDTTVPSDDEDTTGSTAAVTLDSAELTAALEAGTSDRFSLPFMYLTVDQDCDGCAETMSLYYVPSEAKASILTLETAYIDGVAESDFSAVDPSLQAGDPRRIAEQLAGTDAEYSVDPVSGAITSWTLDGNTVTLRCLQVDTRPIDMRTELCENSLIG